MASLEARYLASVLKDSYKEVSDIGIVSVAALSLLGVKEPEGYSVDEVATLLQARFPDGEVPAWE